MNEFILSHSVSSWVREGEGGCKEEQSIEIRRKEKEGKIMQEQNEKLRRERRGRDRGRQKEETLKDNAGRSEGGMRGERKESDYVY